MLFDKRIKSHFHWPLFWVTMTLILVGFINLYSATYTISEKGLSPLFKSQIVWFFVGMIVSFFLLLLDYRVLIRLAYPLYIFSLFLLILVLFFGKEISGNRNWLAVGPFNMQPSELAKTTFIIGMARFFSDHPSYSGYGFKKIFKPLVMLLFPLVLIVLSKDIGSSLFFVLSFVSLLLFRGLKKNVLIFCFILGLVGSFGVYYKVLSSHQKLRISAYLHPEEDPKGRGYHLLQSKIAVGSGRIFGKGYLKGTHNKLMYLPERHTDFIFPVLAEEWGFVGSIFVLGLYMALLLYGVQVASKAGEGFGVFLALGITALFFWHLVINLGGVLGLIPLTGVTLPLLSYGGSSMVMVLIGMSLLLNVSMRRFMF